MLGVVLRELEGPTPGLQELPAIEVHEVCVEVENLSSRLVGIKLFFLLIYFQLELCLWMI